MAQSSSLPCSATLQVHVFQDTVSNISRTAYFAEHKLHLKNSVFCAQQHCKSMRSKTPWLIPQEQLILQNKTAAQEQLILRKNITVSVCVPRLTPCPRFPEQLFFFFFFFFQKKQQQTKQNKNHCKCNNVRPDIIIFSPKSRFCIEKTCTCTCMPLLRRHAFIPKNNKTEQFIAETHHHRCKSRRSN